jgi:hypothetical protein
VIQVNFQFVRDIFDLESNQDMALTFANQTLTSILRAYDWDVEGLGRMVLDIEKIGTTSMARANLVKKTGPFFYSITPPLE